MRPQVREFVSICVDNFRGYLKGPVYEFGSLQVGGNDFADMRYLFPGIEYVGCDLIEGSGVDIVMDATEMTNLENNSVGMILMLEMLEMCVDPIHAVAEARRVLKPKGILLCSSIGPSWPIEKFPPDYWRITPRAYEESLLRRFFQSGLVTWGGEVRRPGTVVGVGVKAKKKVGALLDRLNMLLPKVIEKDEDYDYWGTGTHWVGSDSKAGSPSRRLA